ncbi:MAG: TRAP transporter substrate-binding protein [Bullifex sp.]
MKTVILILSVLLLFPSCRKESAQDVRPDIILRYADNQSASFPTTRAASFFADLVSVRTDGRVKILVYPDAQLGNEREVLDQMIYGGIDFSRFSLGTFSEYMKEFEVLELPFLYDDSDHMWRVLDGEVGDEFLEKTGGSGVIGLSWFDAGARNFYTINKVEGLSGLEGMDIRVQESGFMAAIVDAIGANAIQIPYSDVYSSLQTLKIDGAENNYPSYVSMGHSEVAKYMLRDEHIRIPEIQVISRKTYDKLMETDPGLFGIILSCAKESALLERELWTDAEEKALKEMEEEGVVITDVSEEEREMYRAKVMYLYEERSPEERQLLELIRSL